MQSPIFALTWEIWRRGRKLALLAGCILTVCSVSAWLARDKARTFEYFEPFYYLLMIISLALIFGIFHYAEFNPRKNWHGFPYRSFTLPVPTHTLIGCPMLLGILCVEMAYFAWAQLVFAPLGKPISLWPTAVLAAGLPCYQAVVWSLAGFRVTRLIVLTFAGVVFMDIGALPAYRSFLNVPQEKAFAWLSFALMFLAVASFITGWYSVESQRRGGGRGRGWFYAQIAGLLDSLPRRRKDFSSPAQAQFWFEWRRTGLLLPACTIAALLFIFLPVTWFTRKDSEAVLFTLAWVLALPIILASVIGHGFNKPDFWSGDLALAPFLAVRPLSAGEIIVTKMKVALVSVCLAWVPVLGFVALWILGWANTKELRDLWMAGIQVRGLGVLCMALVLSLVFLLTLTWRAMVDGLWAGLSGSTKRYVLAISIHTIAAVIGIWSLFFFTNHFNWKGLVQFTTWFQWALALAVVTKLWLAVFSWRRISPRRTLSYAFIWACGTAVVVALGWIVCPNVFWLKPFVIMAALLPFPLVRVSLARAALEANRHRQ